MTLLEVVVSTVVLAGSSSAALVVWNQAASEIHSASQLDALWVELETARIATDRWLQSDEASVDLLEPTSPDCRFNAEALKAAVADRLSLGSQVSSRWSVDSQGLGLWLELSAESQQSIPPLKRRLLLTPAAYGLCPRDEVSS